MLMWPCGKPCSGRAVNTYNPLTSSATSDPSRDGGMSWGDTATLHADHQLHHPNISYYKAYSQIPIRIRIIRAFRGPQRPRPFACSPSSRRRPRRHRRPIVHRHRGARRSVAVVISISSVCHYHVTIIVTAAGGSCVPSWSWSWRCVWVRAVPARGRWWWWSAWAARWRGVVPAEGVGEVAVEHCCSEQSGHV